MIDLRTLTSKLFARPEGGVSPTNTITRRDALKALAAASITAGTLPILARTASADAPATPPPPPPPPPAAGEPTGPFTLPALSYDYDALEPHIDAETMHLHHDKHHATYVKNLNVAIAKHPELASKSIEELLTGLDQLPEDIRKAVRNNGGGHYNHSLFWQMLSKTGGGAPTGALGDAITKEFTTFAAFQEALAKAATGQFGSGWAWLTVDATGKLAVEGMPNQDAVITAGRTPLLGIDVWEHAYYLKYRNKRADYVTAFWNVVNWDFVASRYAAVVKPA